MEGKEPSTCDFLQLVVAPGSCSFRLTEAPIQLSALTTGPFKTQPFGLRAVGVRSDMIELVTWTHME